MVGFCRLDIGQEKRALLVKEILLVSVGLSFHGSFVLDNGHGRIFLKEQKT